MNILRSLILAALLSVPLFAADVQPANATPAAPVAVTVAKSNPPAWAETRDAFLSFALDKAKSYTGTAEQIATKAVDTAVAEAGPTAIEFLKWRAWMHGIKAFTCILIFGIGLTLFCVQWRYWALGGYCGEQLVKGTAGNVVATVIGGVVALISFLTFFASSPYGDLLSFVQIMVAPRIYMIEQVLHLFGK